MDKVAFDSSLIDSLEAELDSLLESEVALEFFNASFCFIKPLFEFEIKLRSAGGTRNYWLVPKISQPFLELLTALRAINSDGRVVVNSVHDSRDD